MAGKLKNRLARLRELGLRKAAELPPAPPRGASTEARDQAARAEAARAEAANAETGAEAPTSRRESRLGRALGRPRLADAATDAARGAARPRGSRAKTGEGGEASSSLRGWDALGDLVWHRRLAFADHLPELVDVAPFRALGRRGDPRSPVESSSLRFFDLETTGLSGGAGTVAFLAAVGRPRDGDFVVDQFFLADYPGEPRFLEALVAALEPDAVVVTYNGRAFDLPLLRTRCVMNGMPPISRRDVDVLFAARRLWKRVAGGASLGLLERFVLGLEREEDVAGSMIPEIWFSFLREGDHPAMRATMSHNADDVYGLSRMMARAVRVFGDPRALAASASIDRAGVGKTLLALGREAEAEELLEAAFAGEAGDRFEAGLLLARHYRRQRRLEECRRVLSDLPRAEAYGLERARFLERAEKDPAAALACARDALAASEGPRARDSLGRYLRRLEARLGR